MSCCVPSGESGVELACVPGAIPAAERAGHFELARKLLHEAARKREALQDGYALLFPASEFERLLKFVGNESKCCPFVCFEITLDPYRDEASIRMTGPAGTRELLQAELGLRDEREGAAERNHG